MACNGCTKHFGFFLKEHGCPSCKYSFCSKCLKFRIKIEGKNKDVCLRCYELSKQGPSTSGNRNNPPKDLSILDTSDDTSKAPDVIKPTTVNAPTDDDDSRIRDRLAALKDPPEDQQDVEAAAGTSVIDIEKRLAALKGVEHKDYSEANKKYLLQKDNRSAEEQITDLMKQFAEEREIHDAMSDYRLSAVEDIEKRLVILKGGCDDPQATSKPAEESSKTADEEEEENEEEAARKLAARFLEEAAIDAQNPNTKDDEDELNNLDIPTPLDPSEVQEELPWCAICNEDAVLRCVGCGGDLYCRGCFKEFHDEDDYREHVTKPYKASAKGKS